MAYRKCLSFFTDNKLLCCLLLFTGVFTFVRVPYFAVYNIPAFLPGAIDYILYALQLEAGNMDSYGRLPVGYPALLAIFMALFGSVKSVVFLQDFFALVSGAIFIYSIFKTYPKYLFGATLALTFYLTSSPSITEDHSYDLESVYRSLMILSVALFIYLFRFSNSSKVFIMLAIVTFLAALFRTNGPFIYIIYFFLFVAFVRRQVPGKTWLFFLLPFFIINTFWAAFNYKYTGIFFIGDTKRLIGRYNGRLDEAMVKKSWGKDFYFTEVEQRYFTNKPLLKMSQLFLYLTNIGTRKVSYYSLGIREQMLSLPKCKVQDVKGTASIFLIYDCAYHHDTAYAIYLSRQLAHFCYETNLTMDMFAALAEKQYHKLYNTPFVSAVTRLTDAYHLFHKLINNYFTAILALFFVVYLCHRFFFNDRSFSYLVLLLFLIHLVAVLIVVALQIRYLWRYGFATEFILYFLLMVGLTELYFSAKSKLAAND